MTPDELRALADALCVRHYDLATVDVIRAADYLRACADEKSVGVYVHRPAELRYGVEWLVGDPMPDGTQLFTHPAPAAPQAEPCVGNDPTCPCQDGDTCHYRDTDRTKAWPIPDAEPEREPTLQERVKLVTEEPDAWLITCRAPGRWMEYATVDENDSNHWPVDQWTSIVKAPLYLHLDHVAPQAEPKRLTVEVSLAAGHGYHGYWGVAIGSGVLRFALAAPFATLTEADEYAETLRTALGITGGSDAE